MSPDRHADQLYARLAGGAELTAGERRHVATCAACQRAVAGVARLDEQLRAATVSLASEPIPDADLEPFDAPASGWTAPLSIVIAVGLVGIVIGFALGELRPPTGSDATPTPQPVAVGSGTPAPAASAAASEPTPEQASPTPSMMPEQTPRPIPLAAAGQTCADGSAGFTIVVPEGWYANLRQGDLMACAFIAPAPFDPLSAGSDPAFDAPIRLTTSIDPEPAGTVVDQAENAWTVEREGENWLVNVVELFATIDDEPAYLHLATRASDAAAVEALGVVVDGLTVGDPIFVDPDAVPDALDLFADADVCSDLERGVNVILPDEWWTNTVFGDLQACSYFASDVFEIGEPGAIPGGVAITLEVVGGDAPELEEVIGFETLVVDNLAATRREALPPDTDVYQYVVALDEGSLVLTLRSEQSDDYERDKTVLDEMMRRLIISPTPASVLGGGALPSCGWELVELTPDGQRFDVDARECLWEAYEADEPAEMISTSTSVEGTIIRQIYRVLDPGEIDVIIDWSHDLGQRPWELMRCTELRRRDTDQVSDAIVFDAASCDPPEQLEP